MHEEPQKQQMHADTPRLTGSKTHAASLKADTGHIGAGMTWPQQKETTRNNTFQAISSETPYGSDQTYGSFQEANGEARPLEPSAFRPSEAVAIRFGLPSHSSEICCPVHGWTARCAIGECA